MMRLPREIRDDPVRRWGLRDRTFFAAGACHILAYAFLERHPDAGFAALWIRPARGFSGNHIVAVCGDLAFDYHGYTAWPARLAHHTVKARRWYPGWSATLVTLPCDVLVSEPKSRTYDGLWLREPGQFLHDALPRARAFLERYPPPPPSHDDRHRDTWRVRL